MNIKTTRFDVVDYLDSEEAIQEYFRQVMEDGDSDEIIRALGHIARARGIAQLAKDTGLGRESLYKTLSEGAKPRFDTILRVTQALGLKLTVAH
ncbi:addiction module antidote protein [Oxalobacter formigenes]|uniref:addiction module antidote protein n=1 Tax=Oxalobacter formigenes TaxID=847 RepID=UPI00241EF24B|nr:addiction module antidote protein [Oxalobacter formigenes]